MLVSASVGQTQERVYAGEGGMMFHPILLEKTADFEDVVTRVLDAMSNSADETRRAQAAGWKIYRATEPALAEDSSQLDGNFSVFVGTLSVCPSTITCLTESCISSSIVSTIS